MLNKLVKRAKNYIKRKKLPQKIKYVKDENLTYLDKDALEDIYDRVVELERKKIDGIIIEAGCALGGSAIVISDAKKSYRCLKLYDVFDEIPAPGDKDGSDVHERYETIKDGEAKGIGNNEYYGYKENLLEEVKEELNESGNNIEENNIKIHKGLFENTLQVDSKVALAHIDCDWYESVMVCLERIIPNMSEGGYIVIDDYHHWSGCKQAVDEYFEGKRDKFEFETKSRLHIKKINNEKNILGPR